VSRTATLSTVLRSFEALLKHLQFEKVPSLLYKRIPSFYNSLPDNEVDYAFFLTDARLSRRDCALVLPMADRLPMQTRRKREIKKASRLGLRAVQEESFRPFWEQVLVPRLANRFGVAPVHSVEEITLLASRFPENIKMFSVYDASQILAGTVIYETPDVAHAQYIAVSDAGQEQGALDFLFGWLIGERYKDKRFFDFGICNEKEGRALNHGLLEWKEGFGGRCYVHDFYHIDPASHSRLGAVLRREAGDAPISAAEPANGAERVLGMFPKRRVQ
jgi:hypothetical protein